MRAVVAALLLISGCGRADAQAQTRSACQANAQSVPIGEARAALEKSPDELAPRLKLADTLVDQGCYQEAVSVLEEGQAAHPRSGELSRKLRDVRSMVTEQTYIAGLGQAEESAKLQRNLLRCSQLADVAACDEALKSRPEDMQVLLAKADALLQKNRPADAVSVYRHAAATSPANEAVKTKLVAAEQARRTLVSRCETDAGTAAVDACDGALLHGADDEAAIQRRKTTLLQSLNHPVKPVVVASSQPRVAAAEKAARAMTRRSESRVASGAATPAGSAASPSPDLAAGSTPTSSLGSQASPESPATNTEVASATPRETRSYSNDAPAGRSN